MRVGLTVPHRWLLMLAKVGSTQRAWGLISGGWQMPGKPGNLQNLTSLWAAQPCLLGGDLKGRGG